MPLYAYRCDNCGVQFDYHQSFKDEPLKVCPECGEPVAPVPDQLPEEEMQSAEEVVSSVVEPAEAEAQLEMEEPSTVISCPSCQASITAEAEFCPECGKPVAVASEEQS